MKALLAAVIAVSAMFAAPTEAQQSFQTGDTICSATLENDHCSAVKSLDGTHLVSFNGSTHAVAIYLLDAFGTQTLVETANDLVVEDNSVYETRAIYNGTETLYRFVASFAGGKGRISVIIVEQHRVSANGRYRTTRNVSYLTASSDAGPGEVSW